MSVSKKQFQDAVKKEIHETGDWHRNRVLQCDLAPMLNTASELNQPIHYVANTNNSDYTVTIGKSDVDELARDVVDYCVKQRK